MPIIPTYEDHVIAQGSIQSQANPDDFGAQIGQSLERLGGSFGRIADTEYEIKEAQDVTNVHVRMAKAQADWTEALQERMRTATPGDDSFAPTFMADMDKWFEQSAGSAQTRKGKQVYQTLAANMSAEFAARAVRMQSVLAGEAAKNSYADLVNAGSRTVRLDSSQYQTVLASSMAAIDDGKGMFSKVSQPVRDEFKRQIQVALATDACMGQVERDPNGALASFGNAQDIRIAPSIKVLQGNAVPGGRLDVGRATLERAPAIIAAAADHGVASGVLAAQVDLEGGKGDLQQQSMDMGALLNRYGGDYTKALAAYQMGTTAFDALLSQQGNQWQTALSPAVQNYVSTVLVRGGQVATEEAPANPVADKAAPMGAINSANPAFSSLPGDVQSNIIQKGIHFSNLQRSMAMQEKQMQEMELAKKREGFQTDQVKKILSGGFSMKEAMTSPLATASMLENLDSFHRARRRELKADSENRSNPGEVRRLMLQIHAADSDPTKTYNMNTVDESYKTGRISTNEYVFLRNEVSNLKNGDSNSFTQNLHRAREAIHDAFMKDMVATLPGGAAIASSAYYNAMMDLDKAVAAKRGKNEDPGSLLDPSSRDYFMDQRHLASYMPTAAFAANVEASKVPYNEAQNPSAAGQMKEGTVSQSGKFVWKGGKWVAR